MTIYPDTTFYVALRFFDDTHHEAATDCFEQHGEDLFLWSRWHRVEVCNALRQFARGAQPVVREADARRIIHRLETDVRVGYFQQTGQLSEFQLFNAAFRHRPRFVAGKCQK